MAKSREMVVFGEDRVFQVITDISPPEMLSPVAAELWSDLVPELAPTGSLTTLDVQALVQLCEAYADWAAARAIIAANNGPYYTDGRGMIRLHPAQNALSDADRRLRGWLQEFHLTPSARLRWSEKFVPAPLPGQDDEGELDLSHLSPEDRASFAQMLTNRKNATEAEVVN